MNQFLRRLLNLDTVDTLLSIGRGQQQLIRDQYEIIDRMKDEKQQTQLEHTRAIRDLVEHFFVAQEAGLDVRDELEKGLQDLHDEVARQEEHSR